MAETEDDGFIFISEAAALLGIKTRALLMLIDEGEIAAYKVAGRIGIRRSDVQSLRGIDPAHG